MKFERRLTLSEKLSIHIVLRLAKENGGFPVAISKNDVIKQFNDSEIEIASGCYESMKKLMFTKFEHSTTCNGITSKISGNIISGSITGEDSIFVYSCCFKYGERKGHLVKKTVKDYIKQMT